MKHVKKIMFVVIATLALITLINSESYAQAKQPKNLICIGVYYKGKCYGITINKPKGDVAVSPVGTVSQDGKNVIVYNLPSDTKEIRLLEDFTYTEKGKQGNVIINLKKGLYPVSNSKAYLPILVKSNSISRS